MKFLADESVEKPVVDWLRNQGLDVMYIPEKIPSISDDEDVPRLANNEDRILITNDKDFVFWFCFVFLILDWFFDLGRRT